MALLNVKQVAEKLGFSESWVRQRIEDKTIPHVRLAGGIRFREEDIDKWVEDSIVPADGGKQ